MPIGKAVSTNHYILKENLGTITKRVIKTTSYHCYNAITHFPTLGTYTFSKITMNFIHPKWYRWPKFGALAHGLSVLSFDSTVSSYLLLSVLSTVAMSKRSRKPSLLKLWKILKRKNYGVEAVLYIVLILHLGIKIMPFKLTGYCTMRSKDGKFKPRRRRMQNI